MVFSGIIEEVGAVRALERCAALRLWDGSTGEGWVLTVEAAAALVGAYVGASIAVNGTCLTVTALDATSFTVGLAPETCVVAGCGSSSRRTRVGGRVVAALRARAGACQARGCGGTGAGGRARGDTGRAQSTRARGRAAGRSRHALVDALVDAGRHVPPRSSTFVGTRPARHPHTPPPRRCSVRRTNLLDCTPGSPVNLERALPADGRNSGHYVQGHVDGTGVIEVRAPTVRRYPRARATHAVARARDLHTRPMLSNGPPLDPRPPTRPHAPAPPRHARSPSHARATRCGCASAACRRA